MALRILTGWSMQVRWPQQTLIAWRGGSSLGAQTISVGTQLISDLRVMAHPWVWVIRGSEAMHWTETQATITPGLATWRCPETKVSATLLSATIRLIRIPMASTTPLLDIKLAWRRRHPTLLLPRQLERTQRQMKATQWC